MLFLLWIRSDFNTADIIGFEVILEKILPGTKSHLPGELILASRWVTNTGNLIMVKPVPLVSVH